MNPPTPRDRLIVALDVAEAASAEKLVEAIGDAAAFYKVGMELAYDADGLALVGRLAKAGKRVFVDLKLHDIPNTVERATAQVARLGATFLTVHAYPQTMRAAVGPKMILVTPGIRPAGADVGDQKRVATPASAIRDGASYLVVGRPITQAADKRAAAEAVVSEIAEAVG